MADIDWPDGLPGPLISNYSRQEQVGFIESELTSGPSFITVVSEDNPVFHSVTFQFKKGDARRFQQFLRVNKIKTKSPFFNAPITTEDGFYETQECRFTADGYPQLASSTIAGIFTYNATLMSRSLESGDEDYETEIDAMWYANNGDIDNGASLLDEGLNG